MMASGTTIVRSLADLDSLAAEWAELAEPFQTPLLDHDWFMSAARTLHRESDLHIVTVRRSGRLNAVAPLAVDPSGHLVQLGSSVLHEPTGWLYNSPEALRELIAAVVNTGRVAVIDRMPAGVIDLDVLPRRIGWRALTFRKQTAASFGVRTDMTWEAFCSSGYSRTRKKLAKARERAEREHGAVLISRLHPCAADALNALAVFVDVETRGWKGTAGSALAMRPELLRFFQTYAVQAAARGRLRVTVLRIGGAVAAVEVGVEAYRRMWALKVTYDERLSSVTPAFQLVDASIAATFAAGLAAYEFLGSAESWQERWQPQRRDYELAVIYPLRPRALMTAMRDASARFLRWVPRWMHHQEAAA